LRRAFVEAIGHLVFYTSTVEVGGLLRTRIGGTEDERALLALLATLGERARVLADESPPAPGTASHLDPFRGLVLSRADLDHALDRPLPVGRDADSPLWPDPALVEAAPRLQALARGMGLSLLDVGLLLVALAPDVDDGFERLFGYLHDDVTRRRASVGLALRLCGVAPSSAEARARLSAHAPLLRGRLVEITDLAVPFLSQPLAVHESVTAHLLGGSADDPVVTDACRLLPAPLAAVDERIGRAFEAGAPFVYLLEAPGTSAPLVAANALGALGWDVLPIDLASIPSRRDPEALVQALERAVALHGAALVAGPIDALATEAEWVVRALTEIPAPVVLHGTVPFDPRWSTWTALTLSLARPAPEQRRAEWAQALGAKSGVSDAEVARTIAPFRLDPEQVVRAARAAELLAAAEGRPLGPAELRAGARSQNASGLARLARHVEPAVSLAELVVPPAVHDQLRELLARALLRDTVLDAWGMRPGGGRGRGISALLAGESGTGKTMAAEAIAFELGLELYAVNLATVVDKYVGETEKNLERIFAEADGVNAVLLFDEADALFSRRSEVKDAHDRYANIEVAYLLQRMESFDGIALLSTNLRANVDEAFARRLDLVVEFPLPDAGARRLLWERCLGDRLPRGSDLDLDACAERFNLSGGSIRSAALAVAYAAASAGRPATMGDVIRAVQQEYRKLGRLIATEEFGGLDGSLGA